MAGRFALHLITDRGATVDLLGAVRDALAGGAGWVQVRDKSAPAADLYDLTRQVRELTRRVGAGLLVNDRVDVALAAGAAGVHLARRSLPPEAVRRLVPPGTLVGVSVHSVEEAVQAVEAGADYVTFGSVFPTRSHPGAQPRGLDELARVVEAVSAPVLAIGGITADNAPLVARTGVAGVAVISGVIGAPDPRAAAEALREALERSGARPRVPFPAPPGWGA